MEPWIETASGKSFWFDRDNPENIWIEDIASALSKLCRFTGHCKSFYSVAEHSVNVSYIVPKGFELYGLLHDASEAYLADIASPIKQLLPDYKKFETFVMNQVAMRFNLPFGFDKEEPIKKADWSQLKAEASMLLPSKGKSWFFPEGLDLGFYPSELTPKEAETFFLNRFKELTNGT